MRKVGGGDGGIWREGEVRLRDVEFDGGRCKRSRKKNGAAAKADRLRKHSSKERLCRVRYFRQKTQASKKRMKTLALDLPALAMRRALSFLPQTP